MIYNIIRLKIGINCIINDFNKQGFMLQLNMLLNFHTFMGYKIKINTFVTYKLPLIILSPLPSGHHSIIPVLVRDLRVKC